AWRASRSCCPRLPWPSWQRSRAPRPRSRAPSSPRAAARLPPPSSDVAGAVFPAALPFHDPRRTTVFRHAFFRRALALAFLFAPSAWAAGDPDIDAIRKEINDLKSTYEARIQALEQRLKDAEARAAAPPPAAAPAVAAASS